MPDLYDRVVGIVRAVYDSRISGPPILNLARDFPYGSAFADNWQAIRQEALDVAANLGSVPRFHEIMPEQSSISANDGRDWRMYILKAYGVEQPKHFQKCPTLAALVRKAPEVLSASFSFLGPGKRIPPHRGPVRGLIRYYLVLHMPRTPDDVPAGVLKIANVEYRLEEGQFLLWDDTFEHEAWNESDQVRIVLSLDVWRPHMSTDMRLLSALIVRVVQAGIRIRSVGKPYFSIN